jgi:hypothetical protein
MQSIEMNGKSTDIIQLAGTWEGEFEGSENQQAKVAFAMNVNRRNAHKASVRASVADETKPQPLKVSYVRVRGGEISGTLAPYIDPVCMCTARTTFTGVIFGDVIRGTFVTNMPSVDKKRTGAWSMSRN